MRHCPSWPPLETSHPHGSSVHAALRRQVGAERNPSGFKQAEKTGDTDNDKCNTKDLQKSLKQSKNKYTHFGTIYVKVILSEWPQN